MSSTEVIQGYLKHLNDSIADNTAATAEATAAVVQVSEAITGLTHKLAELFDAQKEQNERINRYLYEQAQKEREDIRLRNEVSALRSEVREKLKAVGG